ncbi:MAG: hypothetical protein ACW987_00200 [Candidatus Thorarchaeota archaeon]
MTDDESERMLKLAFVEKKSPTDLFTEEVSEEGGDIAKIMQKRLALDETEATVPLALLLCCFSENPGVVVMWSYTINRIYNANNRERPVDIGDFAMYFPMGVPTEEGYDHIWVQQKGKSLGLSVDNALDTWEPWKFPYNNKPTESKEEWLKKCKIEAISVLYEKDSGTAIAFLLSEIVKHDELQDHPCAKEALALKLTGKLDSRTDAESFIESIN